MWEAICSLFSWIIDAFFGEANAEGIREGGLISNTWEGVKSIGGGIVDWFADEDVSTSSKLLAAAGAGYLLAPDAMTKALTGVADTIGGAATSIGSGILAIFGKIPWYVWAAGAALIYFTFSDDDEEPQTIRVETK